MKHTKIILRLTAVMFAFAMLISAAMPVYADTIIDYVLYTDIRTYIGGVEISSYNINGYTAVVVEDLANYGFDVVWNGSARTLTTKRSIGKAITGSAVSSTSGGKVGDRAMPVYATDIKTYFDGVEFKSYNVGGKTIVYVDDLANKYSSAYDWNQAAKTLKVTLSDKAPEPPVSLFTTDVIHDWKGSQICDPRDTNNKGFKIGKKTYYEGFLIYPSNHFDYYILFNLEGKYSAMSFDVGTVDGVDPVTLQVYLDGVLSQNYDLSPDVPFQSITIQLNHASSMKLKLQPTNHLPAYGFINCLLYP